MIKNKNILIVGAGGFIGGHLVKKLLDDGNSIVASDIKPKEYWFQDFENVQNHYSTDMKDINNCKKVTKGIDYEMYFQVFDNDGFNGSKKAKSKVFNYRTKTEEEIEEELLQEQRNTINSLENSLQKQQKQQEQLETIQQELQNKKDINWNDKKKIESFLKRQEQYKQIESFFPRQRGNVAISNLTLLNAFLHNISDNINFIPNKT